jgi:hypothetical protein
MKKTIIKTVCLLTGIICLFNTCKKLPPPDEFDPSNTNLHVVWQKPFYTDSTQAIMLTPIISDRYIVWVGRPYYSPAKSENQIVVFDKINGDWHPAWKDGVDIERNAKYYVEDFLIGGNNKNIIFCSAMDMLYTFSVATGQRLWTSIYDRGYTSDIMGRPSILGSDIIIPSFGASSFYDINRYNSTTGQKIILFSFDDVVKTIQWTTNEHNDTLSFFYNGWNKAYCYNLTKDSVVWECQFNPDSYDGTAFQPIIIENKYVLFQHKHNVICVDFSTGKLIWMLKTDWIQDSPILYYDGKIVVRPIYGSPSCYDVRTGDLLWKNSDLDMGYANNLKMDAYKGNLYFTIESSNTFNPPLLYSLSLATGAVNWSDAGPYKGIIGSVTIDQQTGYLYCNSRQSVMCIDLNKTPKK